MKDLGYSIMVENYFSKTLLRSHRSAKQGSHSRPGDRTSLGKYAMIVLVMGLAATPPVYARSCTPEQATAADAMIDDLTDWAKIKTAFNRYGNCDDGDIAEGYSEAVARLLVDHWPTLPDLARLIKDEPPLKKFVLRHIDTTLDTQDLKKIEKLSLASCPRDLALLCDDLKSAAIRAAK